jgi:hypothetical protein
MGIKGPNIPSISTNATPSEVRNAFNSLKSWFAGLDAAGGAASVNDLRLAGLLDNSGRPIASITESSAPPALTGFTVNGAFRTIMVSWDHPNYSAFSHVEIWRSETSDLAGAVLVGTTEADTFSDLPPISNTSKTYYYWGRIIKSDGVTAGPYNTTLGTPGYTADDPEYVLELLQNSKWTPLTSVSLNAYRYPKRPNGKAYKAAIAGTTGATEPVWPTTVGQTVVDGTVTWICDTDLELESPFMIGLVNGTVRMVIRDVLIGDATITNAKIYSVAADKLYASSGTIASAIIGNGHITNAMIDNIIQSTNYSPGSAGWIINKNGNVQFNEGVFRGAVQFTSGSSGYGNLSDRPTTLAGINSTEGSKLAGVATGATSDIVLVTRGNCVATGNRVVKVGGSGAWDSDCYSAESYTGGAYCSFIPEQATANLMVGLNNDPESSTNSTSLDYAIYLTSGGVVYIYESGESSAALTTYVAGDTFTVIYDGYYVNYMKNGVLLKTPVVANANRKFYLDSSFHTPGGSVRNVRFGPTSNTYPALSRADSAQTTANAAVTSLTNWTKPTTTLIDGNKIYTGDAFIYTAMIHDLQVSTLKIANNAVTIPTGAYAASTLLNGDTSIVSITIPTDGTVPVYVMGSVRVSAGNGLGTPVAVTVTIRQNGSTIWSNSVDVPGYGTLSETFAPVITSTPGNGNNVFALYVSTAATGWAYSGGIIGIGIKK